MVNTAANFMIMLNNLQQMHLKLSQKESFKKQHHLVIWLVIKLIIKSQNFQKIHNKIIQKQLETSTIKKYLKKDTYLKEIIDELRL